MGSKNGREETVTPDDDAEKLLGGLPPLADEKSAQALARVLTEAIRCLADEQAQGSA